MSQKVRWYSPSSLLQVFQDLQDSWVRDHRWIHGSLETRKDWTSKIRHRWPFIHPIVHREKANGTKGTPLMSEGVSWKLVTAEPRTRLIQIQGPGDPRCCRDQAHWYPPQKHIIPHHLEIAAAPSKWVGAYRQELSWDTNFYRPLVRCYINVLIAEGKSICYPDIWVKVLDS